MVELPIGSDVGAPGTVVKTRALVHLDAPKRGHLPYYRGSEEIGTFLGYRWPKMAICVASCVPIASFADLLPSRSRDY